MQSLLLALKLATYKIHMRSMLFLVSVSQSHSDSISDQSEVRHFFWQEASDWSATQNTEQQHIADREMRASCTVTNQGKLTGYTL